MYTADASEEVKGDAHKVRNRRRGYCNGTEDVGTEEIRMKWMMQEERTEEADNPGPSGNDEHIKRTPTSTLVKVQHIIS